MRTLEFIDKVGARGGLDHGQAEWATRAVLEVLAERLSHSEAERLADQLPRGLSAPLRSGRYHSAFGVDELYDRVASREGVARNDAVEHTHVVMRAIGEALVGDARRQLEQALSPDIAALFQSAEQAPAFAPRLAGRDSTLAGGRPGSTHPLSEAGAGRPQGHSVATAENPHGNTKLSSAAGLTQERERETLATGHPGSDRPIADAHRPPGHR